MSQKITNFGYEIKDMLHVKQFYIMEKAIKLKKVSELFDVFQLNEIEKNHFYCVIERYGKKEEKNVSMRVKGILDEEEMREYAKKLEEENDNVRVSALADIFMLSGETLFDLWLIGACEE